MFVRVELVGHAALWRFPGSRPLAEWLAWRPWIVDGGVRVLRVDLGGAPALTVAIEREVHGLDVGASGVRFRRVEITTQARAILPAVCDALEVTTSAGRRATLTSLAAVLRSATWVLFLDMSSVAGVPVSALDAIEELRDDLAKLPESASLTAFALVRSGGARGALDFTRGAPLDPPVELLDAPLTWRCYVHTRLAWECAGECARARRWGDAVSAVVRHEDDDGLERFLNAQALEDWRGLAADARGRLIRWFTEPESPPSSNRLEDEGLLWAPGPSARSRPTPWIARAMLLDSAGGIPVRLRGYVRCAPLAEAIIGACLDLEQQYRALCFPRGAPASETLDEWDRFRARSTGSAHVHYPQNCPAVPVDAWDMASFGAHLAATALPRERRAALHELRMLRNAMAHGHYACWRSVTELRAISRSFGEGTAR